MATTCTKTLLWPDYNDKDCQRLRESIISVLSLVLVFVLLVRHHHSSQFIKWQQRCCFGYVAASTTAISTAAVGNNNKFYEVLSVIQLRKHQLSRRRSAYLLLELLILFCISTNRCILCETTKRNPLKNRKLKTKRQKATNAYSNQLYWKSHRIIGKYIK